MILPTSLIRRVFMKPTESSKKKNFKALIISPYAPPAANGSGLMIYNLLRYFPEDSFAVLTEHQDDNPVIAHTKLRATYYYYGNHITSTFTSAENTNTKKTLQQKVKDHARKVPFLSALLQIPFFSYTVIKIVRAGLIAIKNEKPTMLVGYSDIGPCLVATYILHRITKVPFSLYFYDMYLGNKLPYVYNKMAQFFEPKLFKRVSHVFVMCGPLYRHYKEKYHPKSIEIIYNSLIDMSPSPLQRERKEGDSLTILYLGNVYWAQEGALKNLIQAIGNINDIKIKLLLYTSASKTHLESLNIRESDIVHIDTCLPEEVPQVLAQSDIAFAGLSFDTPWPNLINTSSPGRLCDFLRSNTPILIHAPSESFLTSYARERDFAFVVDSNNVAALEKTIREIYNSDKSIISSKVKNAQLAGIENHTAKTSSEQYYKVLVS